MCEQEFCKNCKFYLEEDYLKDNEKGYCRRYPPSVISLIHPSLIKNGVYEQQLIFTEDPLRSQATVGFPIVSEYDWCGEYKKRVERQ